MTYYYFKYLKLYIARAVFRISYLFFPVKINRIAFCSFEGMQYTCNPKYIFESMFHRFGGKYDYIWILDEQEKLPAEFRHSVKVAKPKSVKYIYYLITSGTIINNIRFDTVFPKRKKQLFINTWHGGGAYKLISLDLKMYSETYVRYIKRVRKLGKNTTDYFLSSSQTFTDNTSKDSDIDKKCFIPTGMPRNDRFFSEDTGKTRSLKKRICDEYHIDPDTLWVLYAPTFRGHDKKIRNIANHVCCSRVEDALAKTFHKKVTFLYRRHISKYDKAVYSQNMDVNIVDLTHYPDMQDLLVLADILITDYSSSIWDFSFTGKPGFLYVPDLAEYLYERGFYLPFDKWPFPYAETIDGLCALFSSYSAEENSKRTSAHQKLLGSYECGNATGQVIDIIVKHTSRQLNPSPDCP